MQLIREIVGFWKHTWKTDKVLFWSEAIGTVLGMSAALILNASAPSPNLIVILTLYLLNAIFLGYAAYVRKSSFFIVLMAFYGIASIYGLINLFI